MNFTKEYIKECDCKEIQVLRVGNLYKGDWYAEEGGYYDVMNNDCLLGMGNVWLPTGDQLNNEIEKICKGKKRTYYFISDYDDNYYAEVKQAYRVIYSKSDDNPLIAKIKLLKALLK